eukprot:SAG31_NODE_496_length_14862_cov_9.280837_13_plen_44_part_00
MGENGKGGPLGRPLGGMEDIRNFKIWEGVSGAEPSPFHLLTTI